MRMFVYTDKRDIPSDNPVNVTLLEALKNIDCHPTVDEFNGFIGFINQDNHTIQFIKFEDKNWLIDVPVLVNGDILIEQDEGLNTETVKKIVTAFSKGKNWRSFCDLRKI